MIAENTALLEGSEGFHVVGSKHKEVTSGDKEGHWPPKKAKGRQQEKYHRGTAVKMKVCHKLHSACISTTSGSIFTN